MGFVIVVMVRMKYKVPVRIFVTKSCTKRERLGKRSADVVVDVSHQRSSSTGGSSSHPFVRIYKAEGWEMISLPVSLGMNLNAEALVVLESSLKRHIGIA